MSVMFLEVHLRTVPIYPIKNVKNIVAILSDLKIITNWNEMA